MVQAPPNMQCEDVFLLVQSSAVSEDDLASEEITHERLVQEAHGGEGAGCGDLANCLRRIRSLYSGYTRA